MSTIAKAIAAAVSTFLASLAVVLTGPASSFADVTDGQWVTAVSAALGAAVAVYAVPNRPASDTGAVSVVWLAAVVVIICGIVWLVTNVDVSV